MSKKPEPCWILGFDAEAVREWHDGRIAFAIEDAWMAADRSPALQAWWLACSDGLAFRWYVNEPLARALDDAEVAWRHFVIGNSKLVPADARAYLSPPLTAVRDRDHRVTPTLRSAG